MLNICSCVKDVLLNMFSYVCVNYICNFACVCMEESCLDLFQVGCFFSLALLETVSL